MIYFQKEISKILNTLAKEKFFEDLKNTSQLNEFLLDYYVKNVTIEEVSIRYDEHGDPFVRKEGQINPEKEKYIRNSNEKIKEEKAYSEHLQLIEEYLGINTKKAFGIDIRGSRKSGFYYYIKHAKNNPLRLSVHEKRIEVCKIKASTPIKTVIKEILQEEDEVSIVNFYKQLLFFTRQFKEEDEKCTDKKFKDYIAVFYDTFSKAAKDIHQAYPYYFKDSIDTIHTSESFVSTEKLAWNSDPDLFFMLFSALIEENFLKISDEKQNLREFAAFLHKNFEVKTKIGDKTPYKLNSFLQNLKPSGEFQEKSAHYIELKSRLKQIFKEYL